MPTLNVPATYATPALANAAASSGDIILIEPGTYTETSSINFIAGVTVRGNGATPNDVILNNASTTTVSISGAGTRTFDNLTIQNSMPTGSSNKCALKAGNAGVIIATNVYFKTLNVTCVQECEIGSEFTGCLFAIDFGATGVSKDGFKSISSNPCTLKACLFLGWTGMGVNALESTLINCSGYEDMTGGVSPTYGFWAGDIHNCAMWTPNATSYGLRSYGTGKTMGYSSVYAPSAVNAALVANGTTSDGNIFLTNDIITNGNNLYNNPPTDMTPHPLGLAYQNGNPAYALPATDFQGNTWAATPSRGAYEEAPAGGGGGSGKGTLNNFVNLDNFNSFN
jgi:hypothetical protein